MTQPTVSSSVQDQIFIISLDRIDKLNAFSLQMIGEFQSVLSQAQAAIGQNQVRVVIVKSSSPKAFSAGADLKERMAMDQNQVSQTLRIQRQMVDTLSSLLVPTIAVLNGIAFGGGFELALAADLRVAHSQAKMGLTETSLGIIPGAGGTQRLTRLLGPAKSKEFIFLAKAIEATEALGLGLVNAVDENPLEVALQWAKKMCTHGPLALQAAKRAVDHGQSMSLDQALDFERQCYERVLRSEDRVEGLNAFSQKRMAVYKGQ